MNFHFHISFFELAVEADGHTSVSILEIGWGDRVGALFGLAVCPNCGTSFDLFWIGLAATNE
jgi:hypothetical protein